MAELFLQLSPDEQADILQTCAAKLGRRAEHLEKDVWICWVLQGLFGMPGRLPMAFKGGTSLSKVLFSGLNNCMPSGMAQGPRDNALITCDPGFPALDPVQFAPRIYVINGITGEILANLTQVGGVDYGAYNPTDHHYYLGARDFFTSPTATTASLVLGVIDADTNEWIENFPTGKDAHSVTANPVNNRIFVPIENPNPLCGTVPGCVSIFTDAHRDRY